MTSYHYLTTTEGRAEQPDLPGAARFAVGAASQVRSHFPFPGGRLTTDVSAAPEMPLNPLGPKDRRGSEACGRGPRSAAGGEREPATLAVDAHGNEDSTKSLAFHGRYALAGASRACHRVRSGRSVHVVTGASLVIVRLLREMLPWDRGMGTRMDLGLCRRVRIAERAGGPRPARTPDPPEPHTGVTGELRGPGVLTAGGAALTRRKQRSLEPTGPGCGAFASASNPPAGRDYCSFASATSS